MGCVSIASPPSGNDPIIQGAGLRTEVDTHFHFLAVVQLIGYEIILGIYLGDGFLGGFVQLEFHHIDAGVSLEYQVDTTSGQNALHILHLLVCDTERK